MTKIFTPLSCLQIYYFFLNKKQKIILIFNAIFEMLTVPCGRSHFCKWH